MRLYQLVPAVNDLVVHDEEGGQTVVLTPEGAVFDSEFTDDLSNMTVAFGYLTTSKKWRLATQEEIEELRNVSDDDVIDLEFMKPEKQVKPKKKKPTLKVIQGGK
jgi:hypothetical protein